MYNTISRVSQEKLDDELVQAASTSVQAHEQLHHCMVTRLKEQPHAQKALSDSKTVLNQLRILKSQIEGSYFKFQPVSLDSDRLVHLKHLILSHTPATLQEETKAKIAEQLTQLFQSHVKKIVYACILSCPWFSGGQLEESARARKNILYVVYVATDEQFFSVATPHERELGETLDEGVLFAAEVRHVCSQLLRGNVRTLEAFCAPPESVIITSQEWMRFVSLLDATSLLGKSLVDRCFGQAVGALVKRKKVNGRLVLRDDVTLTTFCDSFRLLSYVQCVTRGEDIISWAADLSNSPSISCSEAEQALALIEQGFEGVLKRDDLLEVVLSWKSRLEEQVMKHPPAPLWRKELGQWLASVRLGGVSLCQTSVPSISDQKKIGELLDTIGMSTIQSCDVLMMVEAGSRLYNLALPTSDIDYIVVYRHPTNQLLESCRDLKESHDTRGKQQEREAGAYESRMFCEMLLKGAVNMIELLYADDPLYSSEEWRSLIAHRDRFISEEVVLQYIGYIKTHMKMIESQKHAGTPRERKIFYSIYHKLLSLEQFIEGKPPIIKCSGEQREFIMKIRNGPLEDDLSPQSLLTNVKERQAKITSQLRGRRSRLREYGDYNLLQSWLLQVRGVGLSCGELKMVTKPLVSLSTN